MYVYGSCLEDIPLNIWFCSLSADDQLLEVLGDLLNNNIDELFEVDLFSFFHK